MLAELRNKKAELDRHRLKLEYCRSFYAKRLPPDFLSRYNLGRLYPSPAMRGNAAYNNLIKIDKQISEIYTKISFLTRQIRNILDEEDRARRALEIAHERFRQQEMMDYHEARHRQLDAQRAQRKKYEDLL
jgi:regulator of replication initiation timing